MSTTPPSIGSIAWTDLTVPNADHVRSFYSNVVGWSSSGVDMGGYEDFCLFRPGTSDTPVAGICHARGPNADLPPQWLIYIIVADLEASLQRCVELGGKVLRPSRDCGGTAMAVIQDPAGAVCALMQSAAPATGTPS